jgi:hypothetical protein
MLKIGVVRWRGKCSRHPNFDPYSNGPGAVKGGCAKCAALLEIHECHRKMVSLMRGFAPPAVKKKVPVESVDDRQISLFEPVE